MFCVCAHLTICVLPTDCRLAARSQNRQDEFSIFQFLNLAVACEYAIIFKVVSYPILRFSVMRSDELEKRMMLACGVGRRRRGRPRRRWMDEIHEVTGMKLTELRDVTTERKIWRKMIKTIARTRRVDSTR